jgi:RNA polymerase sigma factor (sigma-70 family)
MTRTDLNLTVKVRNRIYHEYLLVFAFLPGLFGNAAKPYIGSMRLFLAGKRDKAIDIWPTSALYLCHCRYSRCPDLRWETVNHLVELARNGDGEAEEKILKNLFVRFVAIAKRRLGSKDDAEDIAQEACATVLAKYKVDLSIVNFDAWAYGVLRMKIGNHLQKKTTRQECPLLETESHDSAEALAQRHDPELGLRLNDCVRRLIVSFPRYARVLNLIHQGYKSDEICRKLKISPNNVYVILSRGRSMLRNCLETGGV